MRGQSQPGTDAEKWAGVEYAEKQRRLQRITRMIGQQCPLEEILGDLCAELGETDNERQAAFFLLRDGEWRIAAHGPLTRRSEIALAALESRDASDAILQVDEDAGNGNGCF